MEEYYYDRMTRPQQEVYRAMKRGLFDLSDQFLVPRADVRELSEIFFRLRLDHPELFWAVSFRCRSYADSSNVQLLPEYIFEKGKVREHQRALRTRVEKIVRPIQSRSEWEKEKYIHDFICENVRYDKLKKPYSHEIIGALGHGVAVCEGISKAVKILCDAVGIRCIIAISDSNPEKHIKYRHAWNVVKINGVWYHLDATFDNTLSRNREILRYDYFNLPDQSLFRDHEPAITPIPPCTDGDRFYYKEKKLSFTRLEDVKNRASQAAKKGKPLLFHWRGGYLTREVLRDLLHIFEECGAARGKYPRVSLNWPQAVLLLRYEEQRTQEEPELEDANEGEQDE